MRPIGRLSGDVIPSVVYWNNMPSPYAVGGCNAIARRDNLQFAAGFNIRRTPDRSWALDESSWESPARYIEPMTLAGRRLQVPLAELRATRPDVLVSLYGEPSFVVGSLLAHRYAKRVRYRVLPTYDTWVHRSRVKEATKQLLFRTADGVKVPGLDGAAVARRYGMPTDRIFPVTQSVDVAHYATARAVPADVRARERAKRGLQGCVFLYVGRLWSGKGLDDLFAAYQRVREGCSDASLLMVGDGVDEERYRALARSLPDVWFEGFVQPADLPPIYAPGDVFVFPTLGDPHGLVVEEAMAAGLPVISTEAAGDIRVRLPDGQAGLIVPPADTERLAESMQTLASQPDKRRALGQYAAALVAERTHEQYARELEVAIEQILALPKRIRPLGMQRGRPSR